MTNSYRPGCQKFDRLGASLQIPYSPVNPIQGTGCPVVMFAETVYREDLTNKLKQCGSRKALQTKFDKEI